MASKTMKRFRPDLDRLEVRLAMSLAPGAPTYGLNPPANTIALSRGETTSPHAVSSTTATIAPKNITVGKHSTEFGVFVQPYDNSGIVPRIVAVKQDGKALPIQYARTYNPAQASQPTDMTVAFFFAKHPGPVTIEVAGNGKSTGAYTVETTLVGDVNGDGVVNLADEQAFVNTYPARTNQSGYYAAADSNQNGIINQYDAMALERNMPPYRKPGGGWTLINLAPQDLIKHSQSINSGSATTKKNITIVGYTTPGSIVLADSTLGDYTFGSTALSTDARGFYSTKAINTSGVNIYNFKILDPYGHQYIRSFPVFWTTYAKPNSPYVYEPSLPSPGGGRIAGAGPLKGVSGQTSPSGLGNQPGQP